MADRSQLAGCFTAYYREALLLALGAFLLFYRSSEIPGIHGDEAWIFVRVQEIAAGQPLVGRLAGHSGGLGRLRDPPTELADPMNQKPAQRRRQLRVSMKVHLWDLL